MLTPDVRHLILGTDERTRARGRCHELETADLDTGPTTSVPFHSSRERLSVDGRPLAARTIEATRTSET
jgi:hypothetical protein